MLLDLVPAGLLFFAQASQSAVAGVVRDAASGNLLPEAVVSLPDLDRSVPTDSLGNYRFLEVPPGPQHLAVRRIGYSPRTLHAFVPDEGVLQIDVSLDPVPLRLASLVVRTIPAMRGLDSGDSTEYPDRGISLAAMRNDPFLPEPDGLLALRGGEVTTEPESPSGVHLRGAASDQTGYALDGIPVFSPYHTAGIFSAWNPDAIERVQLSSSSPSPAYSPALAGTITATTRSPGPLLVTQGSLSTSQARLAVDGPVGTGGAGFLVSLRAGYPGLIAPGEDRSYLRGDTRDGLAKLEAPLLRGSLRLLIYDMGNSMGSAAGAESTSPVRNDFEWGSRSIGAQWTGPTRWGTVRLQGWTASTEAEATWLGAAPVGLVAERQDEGLLASVERSHPGASIGAGVRVERSRTVYRIAPLATTGSHLDLNARTPVASLFIQHQRELASRVSAEAAVSATTAAGGFHWGMQGQVRYRVSPPLIVTASYVRAHQFAQSLRNSESVVGNIFPAELYVGAGVNGVPVARNDRGIFALDYRPTANLKVGVQGYLSRSSGLLLVAPSTGEPFAVDGFTSGSGSAPGIALDASFRGSRYGLLASYSWQRLRLTYAGSSYRPAYGTSHSFELGGVLFPSATSSVRLGLTGAFGRRATGVAGDFEWEACNLVDRGCEFGGSPQSDGQLGATRLPAYLRLDLGLRQHWHLRLAGKDVMLALYGTVTNLLGRTNVLTVATDPASGRRTEIEMRPRAPLVIGLDWRF
jgi:hypothetical protein